MGDGSSSSVSSESMNPPPQRSPPSSPPPMVPSHSSPVDCVNLSPPADAIASVSEDPYELIRPSKILKFSESTNPRHHISTPSSPPTMKPSHSPPPMDAIESVREMYQKPYSVKQIDPLITFIENQLQKMNTLPSEAGSSSSYGWLEAVTELAAKTIETIYSEAEKLSDSDEVKAIGNVTLEIMNGVEDLHCVLIGLSVAAYAVVRYRSVGRTDEEWRELLFKILELSMHVKQYSEQMPQSERLCNAVLTIVEGAIIFCDYLKRGKSSRFWLASTAAAQLEKTNQQLRDVSGSLTLSCLQSHWDKDVFLSHSGKQRNFVRRLHRDLTREHVSCFFDESLPLAERFPSSIFEAAEKCKIAVFVISKEFLCSKWPMLELSAFTEAKISGKNPNLMLLPIFFRITPREVSDIKDCPEWQKLEVDDDARGQWGNAVKVVRSLHGFFFGEGVNELYFREKVVNEICCRLKEIIRPQLVDFEPVGIAEQVQQVKTLLDMEGPCAALAVIVYGFGGMGKSTLAASVVESLDWSSRDFKFCWVEINREAPDKTSHVMELQKDIINNFEGAKPDLRDTLEGRYLIKEALKSKSCLLFIDNVVDNNYIRDLLPKDLQPGDRKTKLRIIITSREKSINAELNIICREYEVKGLSFVDSKRLLVDTIVQDQMIEENEKRMINELAVACRGVPLLLSVFGKHLSVERNKCNFQEVLDVLREGNLDSFRDEGLCTKCMFAYHQIKDVEVKEAFLDICVYFHGWEWNLVADIVDFFKLEDLHRRMLVSKGGSGEVIVHDILRLMGLKEARLTRFSNYKELSHALEGNLDGFDKKYVKGISLANDRHLITIQSSQLEAMSLSLRVLILGDWVTLDGNHRNRSFINLRYLQVGDITVFPFKHPHKLDKLRVFLNRSKPGMNLAHLPSSLKHISHEVLPHVECNEFPKLPFQNLNSLKSFVVKANKSVKLPEEVHLPASLVYLDLTGCKNLPKDIGHLTALESVILDRSDLVVLPRGFGEFKRLRHLSMNYCSKLAFLPEEFGMLSSLEALSMKGCKNLRALPESLGRLLSLKTLEFNECINLQVLPESLGNLHIQSLNLHSLVRLLKLPNSFGNMPLLKYLSLESCDLLTSLRGSFVRLKMLENLQIHNCPRLSILPEDFGRLRSLSNMTVSHCSLLTELPHGFGALATLKNVILSDCRSFVKLAGEFTELTSLEELHLDRLPMISRIPDGFGKLTKLRVLYVESCFQLKTLSDDFENLATLERLSIIDCSRLEGAVMKKIVKLPNCYMAYINGSRKLLEMWEHMQGETEDTIAVFAEISLRDEQRLRAIRVALLHGKCMEVDTATDQLIERSSLFVGLEEGISATLALIMLPIHMQSHHDATLVRFLEMTRETAETNGWGKLQIVCARKADLDAERPTPTEKEERAEEEVHQILQMLPEGSCAIPSSESKRVKILAMCCSEYRCVEKLSFFVVNVGVDMEGRQSFKNLKLIEEDEISGNVPPFLPSEIRKTEHKHYNSIQKLIKSICLVRKDGRRANEQSQPQFVVEESKTREFVEALKGNGIHYLLNDNNKNQVVVDDLYGRAIGFIICDFEFLECIKLQQIYKHLEQMDSNFIWIWIPTVLLTGSGHGTYTRLIQCMPWATFPDPQLVNVEDKDPCFVVLDQQGQIVNHDALPLLLGWGVESYPFTQHTIPPTFSLMDSESCLEFLLHGMNIERRKLVKSKMTFLYAAYPNKWFKVESQLEELTQIDANFEVLYVGEFFPSETDIGDLKEDYEGATQNIVWPSLSFSDMIMFWYRCKYLANEEMHQLYKESNMMMEPLHLLVKHLYRDNKGSLVLVDNDGHIVTRGGLDVVQMICKPSDGEGMRMVKNELMKSMNKGECSPIVKTFFRDEIHNHPQHPQHPIQYSDGEGARKCDVCGAGCIENRAYVCWRCRWYMCGSCWMAYAKQVEYLTRAYDTCLW